MSVENNKMQVDIDNLKKQNVNDLISIKELYKRIEDLGEKITQIKYIDNTLVKKIKKEYENLKKIILDENVQAELNNKIKETKNVQVELNNKIEETKNVQVELNNKIEETKTEINEVSSQMEHKANKSEIGSPLIANTASDMVDTTKVYVYVGNEDGYIKGNWYSYNGTSWISGGVYNSEGIGDNSITDDKLNVSYLIKYKNLVYGFEDLTPITKTNPSNSAFTFVNLPSNVSLVNGKYYVYLSFEIKNITSVMTLNLYITEYGTTNKHLVGNIGVSKTGVFTIEGLIDFAANSTNRIQIQVLPVGITDNTNYSLTLQCKKIFVISSDRIIENCKNAAMSAYVSEISLSNSSVMNIIKTKKITNDMINEKSISDNKLDDKLISKINDIKILNNKNHPLFNLFKNYDNRKITITVVGDSTSDKVSPSGGLYKVLENHAKSGELLEGATIIARGYAGITSEEYINTKLEIIKSDNADLYIISLGINDVRTGLTTKEQLKERLKTIVNSLLQNEKSHVLLRIPNSLGTDDTNEEYITPYTSAQEYTDILWNAYNDLKDYWSKDKVCIIDMQDLIFGRISKPSNNNDLMGDVLHPSYYVGQKYIADALAISVGCKTVPNLFKCNMIDIKSEENPYFNYPLYLDYSDNFECLYNEIELIKVTNTYMTIKGLPSSFSKLKSGDIIRFGNVGCYIYTGTTLQVVNEVNTYIPVTLTDEYVNKFSTDNVWHISIYRKQ